MIDRAKEEEQENRNFKEEPLYIEVSIPQSPKKCYTEGTDIFYKKLQLINSTKGQLNNNLNIALD